MPCLARETLRASTLTTTCTLGHARWPRTPHPGTCVLQHRCGQWAHVHTHAAVTVMTRISRATLLCAEGPCPAPIHTARSFPLAPSLRTGPGPPPFHTHTTVHADSRTPPPRRPPSARCSPWTAQATRTCLWAPPWRPTCLCPPSSLLPTRCSTRLCDVPSALGACAWGHMCGRLEVGGWE